MIIFFFSSRRRHTRYWRDWSSDVCSSDLTKTPPAAVLIKKAINLQSGSGEPNKKKVGKITSAQVREIAELKLKDLNAASVESAMRMIAGTARSMGVEEIGRAHV